MLNVMAAVLLMIIGLGCSGDTETRGQSNGSSDTMSHIANAIDRRAPDTAHHKDKAVDACAILRDVQANLEVIRSNAKQVLIGNDSCVLALIDTLASHIGPAADPRYMVALDSICERSDGYVSEYLVEKFDKIYHSNFTAIVRYLYGRPQKSIHGMQGFVVEGLSDEVSQATDKKSKRKEVEKYSYAQAKKNSFSSSETDFLKRLLAQIDENYGD